MPDEFRPFAQLLAGSSRRDDADAGHTPAIAADCSEDGDATARQAADDANVGSDATSDDVLALARDVRCFRALLAERFDACVERLLTLFASDVLGRECLLASADVQTIAVSLLERELPDAPFAIAVHPNERVNDAIAGIAVRRDASVERGTVRFICANGEVTSTLVIRLDAAIRAALCEP